MQLDLLSYTLTPDEATEPPEPKIDPAPDPRPELSWHEARVSYYTRLMTALVERSIAHREANPEQHARLQPMRHWHLTKLERLRTEVLTEIKKLGG